MEATYIQVARMPQLVVDGLLNYFTDELNSQVS